MKSLFSSIQRLVDGDGVVQYVLAFMPSALQAASVISSRAQNNTEALNSASVHSYIVKSVQTLCVSSLSELVIFKHVFGGVKIYFLYRKN